MKHVIWEYNEYNQLHIMRKFFSFMSNEDKFNLSNIRRNSIQIVYLLRIKRKLEKLEKFNTDLEYSFAMETLFCSIPQAFLQTYISIDEMFHNKYNKKQLILQCVRIILN